MSMRLIILGTGGHATSLMETATACGQFDQIIFVDPASASASFMGCPVVASPEQVEADDSTRFIAALGDNSRRETAVLELVKSLPHARFATLVHPSASVSSFARLGAGTVVMQNAVVAANARIGDHCIINSSATVEHDTMVEDFASLAPGAITGGNCAIGKRAAVSIGAVMRHGVRLGEDAILGANSYAHSEIPARTVAYGSPARVVRERKKSYPYL